MDCLFMFSDVSLRAILLQKNSKAVHVQMQDLKNTSYIFHLLKGGQKKKEKR